LLSMGLEKLVRANKYYEAGADLIFIEAPTSKEEMIKINLEVGAPTMAIQIEGGKTPMFTTKELEDIGYNVVVFPISSLYAAAWAVKHVMKELITTGTTREFMDKMITFDDFNKLMGLNEIRKQEIYYYKDV